MGPTRIGGFANPFPFFAEPVLPISGYMGFIPGLHSKNHFGGTWQTIISELKPPSPASSPAHSPSHHRSNPADSPTPRRPRHRPRPRLDVGSVGPTSRRRHAAVGLRAVFQERRQHTRHCEP